MTSTVVLTASATRVSFNVFNDSNQNVLLRFAQSASLSSWTFALGPQQYYESPFPSWQGSVHAVWVPFPGGGAPSGTLQVTELQP